MRIEKNINQLIWYHILQTNIIRIQGCALRKSKGSLLLWNFEIQGAQHMLLYEKTKIPKLPKSESKVPGAIAQNSFTTSYSMVRK